MRQNRKMTYAVGLMMYSVIDWKGPETDSRCLTYLISESRRQASRALPTTTRPLYTSQRISLQPNLPPPSNETRVILAIEALETTKN